jgi:demethylmenaquinone methyltransferase/2-methoxy-6-polyprenyl-1,4-benzoquinol methylase
LGLDCGAIAPHNPPMSEAVQTMFAAIAKRYDLANRLLSCGRDVAWRRASLRMLEGQPRRILDLACGTYDFAIDALGAGKAVQVHGADFCLPMLQAGEAKRARHAITATNGDALHLPYADGSFDVAMVAYGWRNFDDKLAALRELKRVLKPGGQILILEFFRAESLWPRLFHGTFGRFGIPVIGGLISGDRAAYRYLYTSIKGFLSVSEATALITEAGFAKQRWRSCFGGISHAVVARIPD